MPDAARPGSSAIDFVAVEIVGHVAEAAAGVELRAVEAGDAGRFLAAMLQRMEAERADAAAPRRPDAEHAALFAQLVAVERVCRQHVRLLAAWSWRAYSHGSVICRPGCGRPG